MTTQNQNTIENNDDFRFLSRLPRRAQISALASVSLALDLCSAPGVSLKGVAFQQKESWPQSIGSQWAGFDRFFLGELLSDEDFGRLDCFQVESEADAILILAHLTKELAGSKDEGLTPFEQTFSAAASNDEKLLLLCALLVRWHERKLLHWQEQKLIHNSTELYHRFPSLAGAESLKGAINFALAHVSPTAISAEIEFMGGLQ